MDIIMKCKKIKKDTIVYSTRVAPLARVFRVLPQISVFFIEYPKLCDKI